MPYLIGSSLAVAEARSESEASARQCAYAQGDADGTRYWWPWMTHPTSGEAALLIPEADVSALAPEEQAALVETLPEGWEPEPTP